MSDKKGQSAVEYMMLVGITILFMLALLIVIGQSSTSNAIQQDLYNAEIAVFKIRDAVNFVYSHGYSSKTTAYVYLPENIEYSDVDEQTISLYVDTGGYNTTVYAITQTPITGNVSIPTTSGYHVLIVEYTADGIISIHKKYT